MSELYKPDKDDITMANVPDNIQIRRVVVCAAIKYDDIIITGARHYDPIMCQQLDLIPKEKRQSIRKKGKPFYMQGFIDQWGNFMDRKEAATVALNSGQALRNPDLNPDMLFSEDLY